MKYWEDCHPGEAIQFGDKRVERDELLAFARVYDPHPLHLDADAARAGGEPDIRASAWQVACFCMRMMVDDRLKGSTSQGSPGIEELRWPRHVYPGDRLHARQEVVSRKLHPRRPEVGFVNSTFELLNQHDQVVLRMYSAGMFLLRHPAVLQQGDQQ